MTWADPRPSARPDDPAADLARRLAAHGAGGLHRSDEAKHRVDETPPRTPRTPRAPRLPRWAVPALAALAVVVIVGTAVAIGRDGSSERATDGETTAGPSSEPASGPDGASGTPTEPAEPAGVPDLSGAYRGTATIDSVSATGEEQPTRTENVTGRVTCDADECQVQVEYLTDRFRRPITLPAAGGTDSFTRPAQGGDPCDRTPGVSVEARAEGWVRLGPSGLEWRLVNHADKYSDCPGGVFVGGSVSVGTASRS